MWVEDGEEFGLEGSLFTVEREICEEGSVIIGSGSRRLLGTSCEGKAGRWAGEGSPVLCKGRSGDGQGHSIIGEWSGKAEEEVAHIFFFLSLLLLSSKRTWLF